MRPNVTSDSDVQTLNSTISSLLQSLDDLVTSSMSVDANNSSVNSDSPLNTMSIANNASLTDNAASDNNVT